MPKSDRGGRGGQVRVRSLTTSLSLWAIAAVGILRMGWLDHDWILAGAILVVAGAAMPITVRFLKSRDLEALRRSPAGTFFVGGANVVGAELRREARFAEAVSAWHRGWMTGGYIGGTLAISADRLVFTPGPWSGRGVRQLEIPLADVAGIGVVKLPAKVNAAGLEARLLDGSRVVFQVRGFDRLAAALEKLRAQRLLPDTVDVGE